LLALITLSFVGAESSFFTTTPPAKNIHKRITKVVTPFARSVVAFCLALFSPRKLPAKKHPCDYIDKKYKEKKHEKHSAAGNNIIEHQENYLVGKSHYFVV